ncbi:MAG: peptide chain release factor N(5)-glutamine methyltransferase [Pyrinomonadaceae bacterium]
MPTIETTLATASATLANEGIANALRDAKLLLRAALGKTEAFLIAYPEFEIDEESGQIFEKLLERRLAKEPIQYILGKQEFYGLEFVVRPGVLIPRPETEILVEHALRSIAPFEAPRGFEIGIGSGCISVALLRQYEDLRMRATDISLDAIAIARENIEKHGVADRIELSRGDLFGDLQKDERFDLIVSNPPYIGSEEFSGLEAQVRQFEPKTALTDDADGFSVIERIATESGKHLKEGGRIFVEIGFGQSERAMEIFAKNGWKDIEIIPDLAGIPRILRAC